jgi:hypothetical protein
MDTHECKKWKKVVDDYQTSNSNDAIIAGIVGLGSSGVAANLSIRNAMDVIIAYQLCQESRIKK